jgi:hypothetical protein
VPQVRIGKFRVSLPQNRIVRISLGVAFVVLGALFGWLPILGYWMVPLGLLILASDSPVIRRWNRKMVVSVVGWWKGRRAKRAARVNGLAPNDPAP